MVTYAAKYIYYANWRGGAGTIAHMLSTFSNTIRGMLI